MKLRNSKTSSYWFDYLSRAEFERMYLGAVSRPKEFTGTVANASRRKRQIASTLPPECKNLPRYKNWIEEGKTAPVQNQAGCGKIEILLVKLKWITKFSFHLSILLRLYWNFSS